MRLTAKFLLLLLLATAAVLGVSGWRRTQREVELFDADMRRDARVIAAALAGAVEHTWVSKGAEPAAALVADFSRDRHMTGRLLWLDSSALAANLPLAGIESEPHEVHSVRDDARDVVHTYLAIDGPGGRRAILELTESLADERRYVEQSVRDSLTSAGALLFAAGSAAMTLGLVFIARPTQRLVEKARRIGAGDLSGPLRLRQRDELGEVGRAIDRMCEQLDEAGTKLATESTARLLAVDQLRHAERLTTVGKLASGPSSPCSSARSSRPPRWRPWPARRAPPARSRTPCSSTGPRARPAPDRPRNRRPRPNPRPGSARRLRTRARTIR